MAARWLIILIRQMGKVKEEVENNPDTQGYVFELGNFKDVRFRISFQHFKNESFTFLDPSPLERHRETYNDTLKEFVDSKTLLPFMTLSIDSPTSEVQDYRHLRETLDERFKNKLGLYTTVLAFCHQVGPFLERIVTGGEKLFKFYPTVENQKSPPGEESVSPKILVRLCVWWDMTGIIFHEFLEPGQSVTGEVYRSQLGLVKEELVKRGCDLVNNQNRILQHNNASPYTAIGTRKKIRELGFELLPHPPKSKDLLPSHYHLFNLLENKLKIKRPTSVEEVKTLVEKVFEDTPKDFFKVGIEQLPCLWEKKLKLSGSLVSNISLIK